MSPSDLAERAVTVMNTYTKLDQDMTQARMTVVTPKGWKPPAKFPRGELLMIRPDTAERVWSFNAMNVLAWLTANGLVKLTIEEEKA